MSGPSARGGDGEQRRALHRQPAAQVLAGRDRGHHRQRMVGRACRRPDSGRTGRCHPPHREQRGAVRPQRIAARPADLGTAVAVRVDRQQLRAAGRERRGDRPARDAATRGRPRRASTGSGSSRKRSCVCGRVCVLGIRFGCVVSLSVGVVAEEERIVTASRTGTAIRGRRGPPRPSASITETPEPRRIRVDAEVGIDAQRGVERERVLERNHALVDVPHQHPAARQQRVVLVARPASSDPG